jgi:hypothetical protein
MYHVPVTEIMLHLTPRQADALARATALRPPLDPVDAIQRGLTARANPPQRREAVPPRRSTGPLDAQAIAPGEVGVVLLNAGELLSINSDLQSGSSLLVIGIMVTAAITEVSTLSIDAS